MVKNRMTAPVVFCLVMFAAFALLAEEQRFVDVRKVGAWLGRPFDEIAGQVLGPQGGRIFPLWTSERPVSLTGFLVSSTVTVDVGCSRMRDVEISIDRDSFHVRAVVIRIEPPLNLTQLEEVIGARADLRVCVWESSDSEDMEGDHGSLVPAKGGGKANLAVFAEQRLVAEMFTSEGDVEALRWVGTNKSLDGCP
jgi:hypothetical protein